VAAPRHGLEEGRSTRLIEGARAGASQACGWRIPLPPQRSKCSTSSELRFSATLGGEPEVELALV
jgi:hypothetical protein